MITSLEGRTSLGPHPVLPKPLLAQGHPEILPQGSTNRCRISTDAPRDEGARSSLQGLQHVFRALSVSARGGATRSVGRSPARSVPGFWAIGRLIQLWMTLYRPGEGITRARTNSSWPDAPVGPVVVELIVGSHWPPIQALLSSGSRGDAGQVFMSMCMWLRCCCPAPPAARRATRGGVTLPGARLSIQSRPASPDSVLLDPRRPPRRAALPVPRRWPR